MSATWLRLAHGSAEQSVILLGTAFGALFSFSIGGKREKDDALTSLWNTPGGERIDGIRVEQVAGKFVATIATVSTLYLFSDAISLKELFVQERITPIARGSTSSLSSVSSSALDDNNSLSGFYFMTGNSGVALRRFIWAGTAGVSHGQLTVRRRRQERSNNTPKATRSTVAVDVVDLETMSWGLLKEKTGSANPLACNLSTFHLLVLYSDSIYAFNQISGHLTQKMMLCASDDKSNVRTRSDRSLHEPRASRGAFFGTDLSSDVTENQKRVMSSPAIGLARDVIADHLWIYTAEGQFARLVATNEEQTEAWKAAKAMGRFDLAMALAPLVSSGMPDDPTMFQTREAVLEAQADHAASKGNWDMAAQLYAKTNRSIESVVLSIVDSCWSTHKTFMTSIPRGELLELRDLGISPRLKAVKYIITYLVRKLDRIDPTRPMQRSIVATILVQLYSSQLAADTETTEREEVRKDFGNFLADHHQDIDLRTALGILSKNGCHEEAWNLAVLSGNVLAASEISSQRGQVDQSLSLLKNSNVLGNSDMLSQLVNSFSNILAPQAPKQVGSAVFRSLKNDGNYSDHLTIVQGLARVARETKNAEQSREAYEAASVYLLDLLSEWKDRKIGNGYHTSSKDNPDDEWYNMVTFLFVLHAEFGDEADAKRSYDKLIAPFVSDNMQQNDIDTLGVILRCSTVANYRTLCVHIYQALGLHEAAIKLAVGINLALAEERVASLGQSDVTDSKKRQLWCMVARSSDDAVGVVERSKGVLHIEDVLNDMKPFESASERVKSAVINSLEEHKRLASAAKSNAASALETTSSLRKDVDRIQDWRRERNAQRNRHHHRTLICGHEARSTDRGNGDSEECALCGKSAIDSVNAPFDSGLTLPMKGR